jgi:hypothetical protein
MPRLVDPEKVSAEAVAALRAQLLEDLAEILEMVRHPKGRVVDSASLVTAEELIEASLALLSVPGDRDPAGAAREANLAYATMVAGIDLVKSHTDVPRVPPPRPVRPTDEG